MTWAARFAEVLDDARRRRELKRAYRDYLAARRRRGLAVRHAGKLRREREDSHD